MNFDDLKMVDTNILELKNPATEEVLTDNDGNICSLEIYGSHTDIFEKAQATMERRVNQLEKLNQDTKPAIIDFYSCITKEISNVKDSNGEIKDKVYFFKNFQWAAGQVNDFLSGKGNFLKNPCGN